MSHFKHVAQNINFNVTGLALHTVFPRNLAAARFYFKAPFGAATI